MTSDLYATWGSRVRAARLDAGLTQQALADRAGSTKAMVSNIERGKSSVGDALRVRLANVLGLSANDLFPYPDAVPA